MVFLWFSYGFSIKSWSNPRKSPWICRCSAAQIRRASSPANFSSPALEPTRWGTLGTLGTLGPSPSIFYRCYAQSWMVYGLWHSFFFNGKNIIELSKSLVVIRVRVCYGYDWTAYICFDDQIWVKHDDFPTLIFFQQWPFTFVWKMMV